MSDLRKLAQDIGAAPLGDLIASVARGVAEAQAALDAGSLEQCLALYSEQDDVTRLMRQTGYRPTFYTIPETEGELTLSLTITGNQSVAKTDLVRRAGSAPRIYAAPVDGSYQNSYGFSSSVAAKVKFRIVAVPPPSGAEMARVVPTFIGLSLSAARSLAAEFDLLLNDLDSTTETLKITTQAPVAGAVVREGSTIVLKVEAPR